MVSPTQASFVPKRQITDNVVIMQEVLHTMRHKKGGKGYMAIKIDFEKAYDRMRWDFLKETLLLMQVPAKLVDVIYSCVSTCSMSVLWNGVPTEVFQPTRGIRQGDPLSPYLFALGMERLVQMIEWEVTRQRWKPISLCRNGP